MADDMHTCHDGCPCHTGGTPLPDFASAEGAPTDAPTDEQIVALVVAMQQTGRGW